MKIEQTALTLQAQREAASEHEFSIEFSDDFRRALADATASTASAPRAELSAEDERSRILFMLQNLIALLLRIVSGQAGLPHAANPSGDTPRPQAVGPAPDDERQWQWSYTQCERINEHEQTTFSALGQVRTGDGRDLNFRLQLGMERRFSSERRIEAHGNLVLHDPLVVNFDGRAAELSTRRFAFDLDADGVSEHIPELAGSSALLVFDRNGNGRLDDGSELFGTRSGDGFADLARLDDDGNGWIDEADAACSRLQLWRAEDGKEGLTSLREAGIGALGLAHAATPFSLTDADNRLQAQIRATGVYLREDGGAGTLQQVDLSV